jgi:hypothetical protein
MPLSGGHRDRGDRDADDRVGERNRRMVQVWARMSMRRARPRGQPSPAPLITRRAAHEGALSSTATTSNYRPTKGKISHVQFYDSVLSGALDEKRRFAWKGAVLTRYCVGDVAGER